MSRTTIGVSPCLTFAENFIVTLLINDYQHGVLGEIQAGFRKDHSTIDHIFTLFSMIQTFIKEQEIVCSIHRLS